MFVFWNLPDRLRGTNPSVSSYRWGYVIVIFIVANIITTISGFISIYFVS